MGRSSSSSSEWTPDSGESSTRFLALASLRASARTKTSAIVAAGAAGGAELDAASWAFLELGAAPRVSYRSPFGGLLKSTPFFTSACPPDVVAGARLGQSFGRFVWGMRNARGADAESTRS
ncbi:hypothetical protein PGTUg99_021406 [Puccinia graminis f. sp. tritici]|uniref:Uncharacterized protein n=1 Tax=Puccinia graminis f. sp. tritici TaxID=56615 RepID=A0A5B0R6M8_PUCGR|nr:hypothetical protein PGTUg99_021406 [Puccinia graminis f. sp. tritici]